MTIQIPCLSTLPTELLSKILQYLDCKDLECFLPISKQFRATTEHHLYRGEIRSPLLPLSAAIDRQPDIAERIRELKWVKKGTAETHLMAGLQKSPSRLHTTIHTLLPRLTKLRLFCLHDFSSDFSKCVARLDFSSHSELQVLRLPAACFSEKLLPPTLVILYIEEASQICPRLPQLLDHYLNSKPQCLESIKIRSKKTYWWSKKVALENTGVSVGVKVNVDIYDAELPCGRHVRDAWGY